MDSKTCTICGGLILQPNVNYCYSGKVCNCGVKLSQPGYTIGLPSIGSVAVTRPAASVIFNERIVPCDIDDTLVMHENPEQYDRTIEVEDPHHKGAKILLGVNEPMVKLLKDEKSRGAFILVWSRGGYAWAATIVKALGLEDYVDLIMTKPLVYLDDTEVSQWMKDRVYIKPNVTYKKHITK